MNYLFRKYYLFVIIFFLLEGCQIIQALKVGKAMSKANLKSSEFIQVVPFEFIGGHITVNINLNNKPNKYKFLLDTGAPTVISPVLTDSLKILKKIMFSKNADSGPIQNTYCKIENIQIEKINYSKVGAINIDLKKMVNAKCNQVPDGIIGSNVLSKGILQIDFDKKELIITDNIKSLNFIENSIKTKFLAASFTHTPIISIYVNDTIPVNLVFDTGNNGFITLNDFETEKTIYKSISENNKCDAFGIGYNDISGKSDSVSLFSIIRTNLKFGDTTFVNVPCTYGKFKNVSSNKQGSIGNAFMKNFIVTIDWNEKYIYLYPKSGVKLSDNRKSFGISYAFIENKLIIGTVYKNSEAEKLGLVPHDEILSINGILISALSEKDICDYNNDKRDLNDSNDKLVIEVKKSDSMMKYALSEYKLFK
jgi:predicted aspartyl protease